MSATVTLASRLLTSFPALEPLASAWDELSLSRGPLADLYDTHLWLSAWATGQSPDVQARVRVPAVFDGDRLRAVLPLFAISGRRWQPVGLTLRPRFRLVVDREAPLAETSALLVDEMARAGAKEISLPVMPTRDPATAALRDALRRAGYAVAELPGPEECLTPVSGGWDDHRRAFKKYDRTVKNYGNKAARLGPVQTLHFGGRDGRPVDGYETYMALHARGWKGPLREPMLSHRRELLARAGARGWAHLFVMRVADRPAAAIIWFRVGAVAIAYSTVYDQRLAALSAGTIVMWQAHESILATPGVELIDYLPGHGAQKDQLGTERPPLQRIEAVRKTLIAGTWVPLKRSLRHVAAQAVQRLRGKKPTQPPEPVVRAQPGTIELVEAAVASPWPGAALEALDPQQELFLAVAGGHVSPAAMSRRWNAGDGWWQLGRERPVAFARIGTTDGGARPLRELVTVEPVELAQAAAALAAVLHEPVAVARADRSGSQLVHPTQVIQAPLPWSVV